MKPYLERTARRCRQCNAFPVIVENDGDAAITTRLTECGLNHGCKKRFRKKILTLKNVKNVAKYKKNV